MDKNLRLIARLDIKGSNLIKGINLEGLRIIGVPNEYALKYYNEGIDELIYMDSVASLYERRHIIEIIKDASKNIFIPLTVGGGIRSISDAREILRSGADKVAVNTAAVVSPGLINEIAQEFGSQAIISSIEAKKIRSNNWEVYINNGREPTSLDVVSWVSKCVESGAGEILLTSIDREGTRKGFDLELVKAVSREVNVPIIASGGMGKVEDLFLVVTEGRADAIAMADILHYGRAKVADIREFADSKGLGVRKYATS